ncbi:MAG: HK97 family phage prohead protease [Armatimonadetes bacterium]|nr:HK97 family phage prohead protease [Armatimonadota bacterium]
MLRRYAGGRVLEVKQEQTEEGIPVGIVAGHLAAWAPDEGGMFFKPDKFHRGAFLKSIQEHKDRDNRPIRFKDQHFRIIGGFPIKSVHEDEIGLFARGEVNLNVQLGREAHSLAMQDVLRDFSIGFIATRDDSKGEFRDIFEADIFEASIIDEPMNRAAQITEVKSANAFQNLPVTGRDEAWDEAGAASRVRSFTDSEDSPTPEFKKCFLWHDATAPDSFDSYRFLVCDVKDGQLMVVPRALADAARELQSRAGDELPESTRAEIVVHAQQYYAKMGITSPFKGEDKNLFVTLEALGCMSERQVERSLIASGRFSKKAAAVLAGKARGLAVDDVDMGQILEEIRKIHI